MPISNYPGGFPNGVNIRGMNVLNTYGGDVKWVDSGNGSNGNPGTFNRPYSTIDYAIGRMTANNGDIIMVKPGHVEDLSAASAIDFDVAGLTVMGLGNAPGTMPRLDWEAAAATLVIDAANTVLYNLDLVPSFLDVAEMLNVGAVDGVGIYNCAIHDEAVNLNRLVVADFADGADRVSFVGNYVQGDDAQNDEVLNFAGTHNDLYIADNYFAHSVAQETQAPMIETITAATGVRILNNDFVSRETAGHWAVLLTGTSNRGVVAYNRLSSLDAAGHVTAGLDITGANGYENYVAGETGTYALVGGAADGIYNNA